MATTKKKETKSKQYVISSEKINILLMGTSGAGKSTLINAILPDANAPTGMGRAVTKEIIPYTSEDSQFTLIDSIGYEFNILKQLKLKNELNKWMVAGVKKQDASKYIHMIWFCVDAQVERVFDETLDSIRNVAKTWKNIPIIVVFTKSYGTEEDDKKNIEMFQDVLSSYKHAKDLNIKEQDTIPVVALEKSTAAGVVPVKGLGQLISRSEELIPEAEKVAKEAANKLAFDLKKTEANAWVGASVAAAATIGAVPIPFPDAALLVPLQTAMVGRISKIYGIGDKNILNSIVDAVLKASATTIAGKALLNALKGIPGMNIAAAVLNAAVAGVVTAITGEATVFVFEGIAKGNIKADANVDWIGIVGKFVNDKLPDFIEIITKALKDVDAKDIPKAILTALYEFISLNKKNNKKK